MISCVLKGRLGNQMFIIAATAALAKRNNVPFLIPSFISDPNCKEPYFNHLPAISQQQLDNFHSYKEPFFHFQEIPYKQGNLCLDGYFQSEKYFTDYKNSLHNLFNFQWKKFEAVVGIHVRRGDYLRLSSYHPPVTIDYLTKSIFYFKIRGYNKFMVFSDDMLWCKNNLSEKKFSGFDFQYSEGYSEKQDLERMSCCEHLIMSNSSFSWWAGYLNEHPGKIIIAPKKENWFGDAIKISVDDLYCDNWVLI